MKITNDLKKFVEKLHHNNAGRFLPMGTYQPEDLEKSCSVQKFKYNSSKCKRRVWERKIKFFFFLRAEKWNIVCSFFMFYCKRLDIWLFGSFSWFLMKNWTQNVQLKNKFDVFIQIFKIPRRAIFRQRDI